MNATAKRVRVFLIKESAINGLQLVRLVFVLQTVDEMYAKAHDIVGLLYSLAGSGKRKRCTINEEKNEDDAGTETDDEQPKTK